MMKTNTAGSDTMARSEGPGPPARPTRLSRPQVNITRPERAGRIVIGLVGVVAGVILLVSAGSALVVILEILLVVAGLDLVITGALGHCPLYHKLGHVPASLRRQA